jgi:hypothetical protein
MEQRQRVRSFIFSLFLSHVLDSRYSKNELVRLIFAPPRSWSLMNSSLSSLFSLSKHFQPAVLYFIFSLSSVQVSRRLSLMMSKTLTFLTSFDAHPNLREPITVLLPYSRLELEAGDWFVYRSGHRRGYRCATGLCSFCLTW